MDPFIEASNWPGFQTLLIGEIVAALVPQVRPRYAVILEQRVYIESVAEEPREIRPDVPITRPKEEVVSEGGVAVETVSVAAPAYTVTIPAPQEEPYLEIRLLPGHELVTVIEVLSPSNKRDGAEGRQEYLKRRNEFLRSQVHLVEIDLLRGGLRAPTDQLLKPSTHYCVLVHRASARPFAKALEWTIRERLPVIPVPLAPGDADASVALQEVFDRAYERAGYDYLRDYTQPLFPALYGTDAQWVKEVLLVAGKL
jgi:hypothetical protein